MEASFERGINMKKTLALFLALLLVLSFTACGSSTEATTEATTEVTTVPTTETTEAVVDYNAVAAAIEATGTKFDYWNVDVIGEAFFINFAFNGMSDVVEMFKEAGYDENYSEWVTVKETVLSLYQSNVDLMKSFGVENPMCFLSLVNDQNYGEIFVSVYNGEITDDIMKAE
jgi:hypothetical protein